jgi:hypothetical protein
MPNGAEGLQDNRRDHGNQSEFCRKPTQSHEIISHHALRHIAAWFSSKKSIQGEYPVIRKSTGALFACLMLLSGTASAEFAFGTYQSVPSANPGYQGRVLVGDLTGDLKNDILVTADSSRFNLLVKQSSGFTETTIFDCAANGLLCYTPFLADFNNDGILDIAYSEDSQLGMLLATGGGSFHHASLAPNDGYCQPIAAADVDADGNVDLLTLCAIYVGQEIRLMRGDGAGNFISESTVLNYVGRALKTADWNGDGATDLIVLSGQINNQSIKIYLNDGAGNFSLSKTLALPDGGEYKGLGIADFNGDALLDVAVFADMFYPAQVRQVEIFGRDANGDLIAAQNVPVSEPSLNLAAFDLDHNGSPDLLTSNGASLRHYLNNAGSFAAEVSNATGWNAGYGLTDRSIGDLNGDGCEDAALYEESVGVDVLYGQCGAPAAQSTAVQFRMKPSVAGAGLVLGLRNTDKHSLEFTGLVKIKLTPVDSRVSPIYIPTGCSQSAFENGTWSYDCLVVSLGALNSQYFAFGFTSTAGTQHELVKLEATVTAGGANSVVLDAIKNPVPISVNGYKGR